MVMTEQGEAMSLGELTTQLPTLEPTLFVTIQSADLLAHLNGIFLLRDPDHWQWRVSTLERDICTPDGVKVAARVSTVVHYFGFKGGNYHKIIDPVVMYGKRYDDVLPIGETRIGRLRSWGIALRNFCDAQGVDVRPTSGGIASQFLTDHRFYPHARRKVPTSINERVRECLPGNHYQLNIDPTPGPEFTAHYLDQKNAHHYHAQHVTLPSANHLYAYGRFTDLSECVFTDVPKRFHGLYCLDLEPPQKSGRDPFLWLSLGIDPGAPLERVFIFSNELHHLADSGFRITGIRAAWGSSQPDCGIPQYARWAQTQLALHHDPTWLKSILLSTYGTLATKPRVSEAVFRLAASGSPVELRTGHRTINGLHSRGKHKLEPRIANVLHRGMIEAATRSESVGLAQWLTHEGFHVLSIYADAVMIEHDDDKPLPPLPEPWRSKQTLNHLQFLNQQAFVSGEMTKLPGISREIMPYRQHAPGHAPRKTLYEAISGRPIKTDRRI
jgi:hypothetical protein